MECGPHPEGKGHRYKLTEATTGEVRESGFRTALRPRSSTSRRTRKSRAACTCIGTERHEARRIDRQLRGRCARQGDPGSSHFFISLEDDLMRLFGSDSIVKYMEKMGLEEGAGTGAPAC